MVLYQGAVRRVQVTAGEVALNATIPAGGPELAPGMAVRAEFADSALHPMADPW